MYLTKSVVEGLKILGFDKEVIKRTSKERNLEEIFLSTLFLNYFIVLVVYIIGLINGGYSINGRALYEPVLYGLLMIYPFTFNLVVYGIYSFFGLMAEMLNKKKTIKPLLSVGFHTAIVYTLIIYVIALISSFNLILGGFLFALFFLYFLYTMFLSISLIYEFSVGQTLIVLLTPFLLFGFLLLVLMMLFPNSISFLISKLFV